jgi:predicted nucleic acid-binding Zn ribbon protein
MSNELSCDLFCPACGAENKEGKFCSEACQKLYEADLDRMYAATLEERENTLQRKTPQAQT